MDAIHKLCFSFYLTIRAHSCFGGFFSNVLAHFLLSESPSLNMMQLPGLEHKIVILGFYAGKSHNLIGLGIFHGDISTFLISRDLKSLDLHEKSVDLSNYEIFPHKILKSLTFKKSSILIVIIVQPVQV